MARTKLRDRVLPRYTRGEENFNMISHIVGFGMSVVVFAACVIVAAWHRNVVGVVSAAVYGAAMVSLYAMSSIYHGLRHETAKKVFQILDHCTIYFLIAGTYTPVALSALWHISAAFAWTMFGIEWGLAIVATVLTAIDLKKFQVFSMVCYLVMGWLAVLVFKPIISALTGSGFALLISGGVLYSVGAILYGAGKRVKYMHNVFHVFVVLGSFIQFLCIIIYAL